MLVDVFTPRQAHGFLPGILDFLVTILVIFILFGLHVPEVLSMDPDVVGVAIATEDSGQSDDDPDQHSDQSCP
jgi:hypothetical protein